MNVKHNYPFHRTAFSRRWSLTLATLLHFNSVRVDNKYGYIDRKEICIIKPQFKEKGRFIKGITKVKVGDKEGYVNKAGEIVMEP